MGGGGPCRIDIVCWAGCIPMLKLLDRSYIIPEDWVVIVCDLPGGGAPPKMLWKAASL